MVVLTVWRVLEETLGVKRIVQIIKVEGCRVHRPHDNFVEVEVRVAEEGLVL